MISESNVQYVIVTKAEYKRLMKLRAMRRRAEVNLLRLRIETNRQSVQQSVQRIADSILKDKP